MSSITSLSDESVTSTHNLSSLSSIGSGPEQHHQPLPWIVHHLLECEIPDELPLRIMFSYNSGAKMPSLRNAHRWWNHEDKGKMVIDFISSLPSIPPATGDAPLSPIEDSQTEDKKDRSGKKEINNNQDQEDQQEISDIEHLTEINIKLKSHHHPQDRFMDEWNGFLLDASNFGAGLPPQLRSASQGLPLDFIVRFCLRVMTLKLEEADFLQALTAIDYLRDYECSRRRYMQQAMIRIGFQEDADEWIRFIRGEQDVKKWVEEVQRTELRIEKWYAEVFVDLRIWTMAMELKSKPFYKPNALAMLNTLFPPSIHHVLNAKIDVEKMYHYRAEFYESIGAVAVRGSRAMDGFIEQLEQGDKHSWKHAHSSLECYFDASQYMLKQVNDPNGVTHYFEKKISPLKQMRPASGYSTSERPRTGSTLRTYSTNRRSRAGSTANSSIVTLSVDFKASPVGQPPPQPVKLSTNNIWTTMLNHPGSERCPATNTDCQLDESGEKESQDSGKQLNSGPKAPLKPILKLSTPRTTYTPVLYPTPFPGVNRQIDPDRPVLPLGYRTPSVVVPLPEKSPDWNGKFVTKVVTPKMGSSSTNVSGSAKLPSDNFDFLNRPFEEQQLPSGQQVTKKKSSFGKLFTRKISANGLREAYAGDGLGIEYNVRSTESLPTYSNNSRNTTPTPCANQPTPASRTPSVRFMEVDQQPPKDIKKMKSMTSLFQKKPLPSILKNKEGYTSSTRARAQTAESQVRPSPRSISPPMSMPIPIPKAKGSERKDSVISQGSSTPPLYPDQKEYDSYERAPDYYSPAPCNQDFIKKYCPRATTPTVEDCDETLEQYPQFTFQSILNESGMPRSQSTPTYQTQGSISPNLSQPKNIPPKIEQNSSTKPDIGTTSPQQISSAQSSIESPSMQSSSLTQPDNRSPSAQHTSLDQPDLRSSGIRKSSLSQPMNGSPSMQLTGFLQSNITPPTVQQQISLSQRTTRPPNAHHANFSQHLTTLSSAPQSSFKSPNRPPSGLRESSLRDIQQSNFSSTDLRPPPPVFTNPKLRHTTSMPAMRHRPAVGSPLSSVFYFDDSTPIISTPTSLCGKDETTRDWLKYEHVDDVLSEIKREEKLEKTSYWRFWWPKVSDADKKDANKKAQALAAVALAKKNAEADNKRLQEEKMRTDAEKNKADVEKRKVDHPPAPTPNSTDAWTKSLEKIGYGYRFT